jgi:hypothetical protein
VAASGNTPDLPELPGLAAPALHGLGPKALRQIHALLAARGLALQEPPAR